MREFNISEEVAGLFPVDIVQQADRNIGKWGRQDLPTLLLAAQEELGELTQAYLQGEHEGGKRYRVWDECRDLGALLVQIMEISGDWVSGDAVGRRSCDTCRHDGSGYIGCAKCSDTWDEWEAK